MSTDDPTTQDVHGWSAATTTASSMFVGQRASSNLGLVNWNQVDDMSMQGHLLQDSSNEYSGHFKLHRSEDSSASAFYLTDFQRQFFW